MALKSLGKKKTLYHYAGANAKLLEKFENPFKDYDPGAVRGTVLIVAPEFTSLCPKTGQPDFATIEVQYTPNFACVESKSFKLYLGSFRQHKAFHESCVKKICDDLVKLLQPESIRVTGKFTPRGGISFWPSATWQDPAMRIVRMLGR